ncbi:2Fe-2S iron-sulfur cluster binding domain-containing protein [Nocardia sp. SYP-A9097]|uniref:PDR/VanB family oxidoreductase n=1 Tax=Nocardia sp. SYP-A9097 TaxID=2663237 RepID=UPI00129B1A04|nr:PDR/VanB family oxidoreductase [Nocardia sp. SYP-A9097]MRH88321.1 2Fe-2S iron-sulfur cluster binding domain-containing protein [Nocardia sp. SYP-A9097]
MTELMVRVTDRRDEAEGVFSLGLAAVGGGPLPHWTPGAHIDVSVGTAGVRQYSLCGDPADERRWRIAILHEPAGRGGSDHLHRTARPGAALRVSLPRNNFELVPSDAYLFVAGGIGITPILPMLAAAQRAGASWTLYYGARSRAHLAFTGELSWHRQVRMVPQDELGLLPVAAILGDRGGAEVYCCGPAPLLDAIETEGARTGVAVHIERFVPRQLETAPDREFELQLARTGRTLRVPAGRPVIDVLESAGVTVVTSCREGTCGSCETAVLSGSVEHRDSVLSAAERAAGATMMPCVSRAVSDVLVLDL